MVEMSEPAHLTDMAVDIGVKRGLWGQGKSSVYITIENKHCNKGGVAHGGLYTMMLDMALGGALVSILPKRSGVLQRTSMFLSYQQPDREKKSLRKEM